jgi:DivIVA domain-containing protein
MLVPTANLAAPAQPGGAAVPFLFMLVVVVVITVVALVVVGRLDATLPDVAPDLPPLALPDAGPLAQSDVDGVRFGVGVRGYRMDEVDDVLDRLGREVADRDLRISELEQRLAARGVPRPEPFGYDQPDA